MNDKKIPIKRNAVTPRRRKDDNKEDETKRHDDMAKSIAEMDKLDKNK